MIEFQSKEERELWQRAVLIGLKAAGLKAADRIPVVLDLADEIVREYRARSVQTPSFARVLADLAAERVAASPNTANGAAWSEVLELCRAVLEDES